MLDSLQIKEQAFETAQQVGSSKRSQQSLLSVETLVWSLPQTVFCVQKGPLCLFDGLLFPRQCMACHESDEAVSSQAKCCHNVYLYGSQFGRTGILPYLLRSV